MKIKFLLLLILMTALFLRVYPAVQSPEMLKFDSYYHARTAELIKNEGFVSYEPYPYGGKPLLYPPGYHLLLIFFSFFGFSFFSLAEFLLLFIFLVGILASFWIVKKYLNEKTALITALLLAINPVLITESFGSPQVIGFLFFLAALHLFLTKKHALSGLVMGICFWFTPMGAVFFSIPLVILALMKRQKLTRKFLIPSLAVSLSWLALRADLLYAVSSSALEFFAKGVSFTQFINPWYFLLLALVLPFARAKNDFQKAFLILTLTSLIFYLSFYFTNAFHPWRQPFFMMIGLSFVAADVFLRKKKIFAVFSVACIFLIYSLSFPGLSNADFNAISQFSEKDLVLAGHDSCAVIMTNTEAQCMLDIGFESIEDNSRFCELQGFFWASKPESIKKTLESYPFNKVLINSNAWGDPVLEHSDLNKVFLGFECWENYCMKPASVYEVVR